HSRLCQKSFCYGSTTCKIKSSPVSDFLKNQELEQDSPPPLTVYDTAFCPPLRVSIANIIYSSCIALLTSAATCEARPDVAVSVFM
ncbi:MAG: hypothetical protein Q4F27_05315, partial [Desulfovibrionaceae bacterium]|nr:hypothetical protein [Desulfovibrionaceae bacterium]